MMFSSISIATSVAIGLHFARKLRRKFQVAHDENIQAILRKYPWITWGGPGNPVKIQVCDALNQGERRELPDDIGGIIKSADFGRAYHDKSLTMIVGKPGTGKRFVNAPPEDIDRMHGFDVEKMFNDAVQDEIRSYIDNLPPKE